MHSSVTLAAATAYVVLISAAAVAHGSSGYYQPMMIVTDDNPREKECLAGVPANPGDVQRARDRIERTMAAYFALTPQSSPDSIRAIFTGSKKDIVWKFDGTPTPVGEIGSRLEARPAQRALIATVVGGDTQTARAIWAVTPATGSGTEYYAGDFVNEGWLGGWKIWHLAIFPESKRPDTPSAYCHFDPDQAF